MSEASERQALMSAEELQTLPPPVATEPEADAAETVSAEKKSGGPISVAEAAAIAAAAGRAPPSKRGTAVVVEEGEGGEEEEDQPVSIVEYAKIIVGILVPVAITMILAVLVVRA
jgi:hypothetical protein